MRTENIDMIFAPKAKSSPAALRPGGDASRGGAPAEGREARERFELPEEARQTRQDQAATRRADARSDDMRRDEMRMDVGRRDEAGSRAHVRRDARAPDEELPSRSRVMRENEGYDGVGRDEAPDRQKMQEAHEKRGIGASAEAGPGASAETDLAPDATAIEVQMQVPVSDMSEAGLEGLDTEEKSRGSSEMTPIQIIAEGATAVPVTPSGPAAGVAATGTAVEKSNPLLPQQPVAPIGGKTVPEEAAATAVFVTSAAASVGLPPVKPELGSSEAGRPRRGDASAAGAAALGIQIAAAQPVNGSSTATAPTFSGLVLDAPEGAPSSPEPEVGGGEGGEAPAMDDASLRRALGQLGLAAPEQGAPPAAGQGQAQAQAQAVVFEVAQSDPAASQQGLAQALSSLAEAAGKAAVTPATPTVPTAPILPNVPLGAVPIEIGLKALAGVNHFQIRLDPAELGRIDVNLEIETDGTITARLTVDRVETLSLLQRDARMLERAFEQAGFKPSEGGLDLSLRDQGGRDDGRGEPDRGYKQSPDAHGRWAGDGEAKQVEPTIVERTIWRGAAGVDVRI